ncbi:MAG: alpha/beta fold hydrolase [Leptospirales bacterium]
MIEQYINTPEGKLFVANYPGKQKKNVALVLHGWGENSKWYIDVSRKLNSLGWSVVLLDLRGHGRSFGKRGFIHNWEEYAVDLEAGLRYTLAEYTQEKLFLFGQSMGALVILRYLQTVEKHTQLAGAILASLPIHIDLKFGRIESFTMRCLNYIYPSLGIKYKLPKDLIRSNKKVVLTSKSKHYGHRIFTPRWFVEFHKNIELARVTDFPDQFPILILHGANDLMIDLQELKSIVTQRGVVEENIISYENIGHKIFQEKKNKKVYVDILNWLAKNQEV